jgi:hypothetical protein
VPVLLGGPDDAEDEQQDAGLGGHGEDEGLVLLGPDRCDAFLAVALLPGEPGEQRSEAARHHARAEQQAEPDLGREELRPLGADQADHRAASWAATVVPGDGAANCSEPLVSWK